MKLNKWHKRLNSRNFFIRLMTEKETEKESKGLLWRVAPRQRHLIFRNRKRFMHRKIKQVYKMINMKDWRGSDD